MNKTGRPHILVVEDDKGVRDSMASLLDAMGFDVDVAGDGSAALETLRGMQSRPCVILLDLAMPVMDGEEFLQHQAADPDIADIPVFLISANTDLLEKASSPSVAGALRKPISLSALSATLERYCAHS